MSSAKNRVDRKFHKPRYYGELTGKSTDYVRARIHDGSLRAFNLSVGAKSDWYVHEDDWAAFLKTKVNRVPTKPRSSRQSAETVHEYY